MPKKIFTSLSIIWITYIFLGSLPYKFTNHEHTKYIFDTIGEWISSILGETIGTGFMNYGAYGTGIAEFIVSLILFVGLLFMLFKNDDKNYLLAIGGIGTTIIMTGAVFFHLFTPLGIEVNGDGGSLFKAAVSIWFLGIILFILNFKSLVKKIKKLKGI